MKTKARKAYKRGPNHQWTKSELTEVISLWDKETVQGLADRLGLNKTQIQQIATRFRKMGVKLTRKRQNGYLDTLMKEVVKSVR